MTIVSEHTILVAVAVLRDSRVIGCCPAWQIVVRLSVLS